jgi:hypothetical protein
MKNEIKRGLVGENAKRETDSGQEWKKIDKRCATSLEKGSPRHSMPDCVTRKVGDNTQYTQEPLLTIIERWVYEECSDILTVEQIPIATPHSHKVSHEKTEENSSASE